MATGLLIDAFVVRTILVPVLLALVGSFSAWPGRGINQPRTRLVEERANVTTG
jgi:uncharacterized membrane protein YdfJ with MMPL/SSD domain